MGIQAYLIIIAVTLIAHFRALRSGYIVDDEAAYRKKVVPANKAQEIWWQFMGIKYYEPQLEHLMNLTVHLINCLLIYIAFGRSTASLMAAVLFSVHPAGMMGSVWLSGRMYAVAAMFALLAYALKAFFPIPYLLGTPFSLSMLLTPLTLLRTPYWYYIVFIPVFIYLAKYHRGVVKLRYSRATSQAKRLTYKKAIVFCKSLGYYMCLSLIPTKLGVYHDYLYNYCLTDKDNNEGERVDRFFWIGLIILYLLITNYIFNYNEAMFGLFWFVLFIAQWCNIMTLQQAIAERYLYLPLAGVMYMISNMILATTYPGYIYIAIFVYYLTRFQIQIGSFKNAMNCAEYNILNFPKLYACWTWKGQIARESGRFFTALESWFEGWKLRKNDFRLNNNIAIMLTEMGFFDDAEGFLNHIEANAIPEQAENIQKHIAELRQRIRKARQKAGYPGLKLPKRK